ncbi:SIR2 family protein [Candidatus Microgenomates bacterium]|nr:SIR2 family protein [Candidatus Microgenomates bacterium]
MDLNYRKNMLLFGAGFTANFGGFLAREMWVKIFNNPDLNQLTKAKELFKNSEKKFDFENIFSEIILGDGYSSDDKTKFEKIIIETYISMQLIIGQGENQIIDSWGVNQEELKDFLSLFFFNEERVGVCFTLNQDLFFEQKFGWQPFISKTKWFSQERLKQCGGYKISYSNRDPHILPNHDELNRFSEVELVTELESVKKQHNILYMKLHGSLGWVSSDGTSRMIIGKNKKSDIEKEPLLNFYFQEFKKSLNQEEVRLLLVGYGFRDEHINECLVNAIDSKKLKLYIISPESPELFQARITHKYPYLPGALSEIDNNGVKIWNAVEGFFPNTIREIFPRDGRKTNLAETLIKIFK